MFEISKRDWKLFRERVPVWQEHYMELSPQIASEIEEMLETDPPIWIVTKAGNEIENSIVKTKLQESYVLFAENGDYSLYRLK